MKIELNGNQQQIVDVIEKIGGSCTVYMPRGDGKSRIVAYLSDRYNAPVIIPVLGMGTQLKAMGVQKILSSHTRCSWNEHHHQVVIVDEIDHCKNKPGPEYNCIIAFTSCVNDDMKDVINPPLDMIQNYIAKIPSISFMSGWIIKPGVKYKEVPE